MKPAGKVKERLTAVCEVVEEEGGKIKEQIKKDKIGQIGDALNKL